MKMTPLTIGKIVGVAAVVVAGAIAAGRGAPKMPDLPQAQPTISAPAATSADITALRQHVDERFDEIGTRQDGFNGRLSTIEGYMKAQQDDALRKALAGKPQ